MDDPVTLSATYVLVSTRMRGYPEQPIIGTKSLGSGLHAPRATSWKSVSPADPF